MVQERTAIAKMEHIQTLFKQVQTLFDEDENWQELITRLDQYDLEFRSIAYEAAAMSLALKDLATGNDLSNWRAFSQQYNAAHGTQIHVGLGWAFAQLQTDPSPYLPRLADMMRYRVLDGYGYYEGTFRKRRSVVGYERPSFTDPIAASAYDQGLGRSLWYSTKGDIDTVIKMIAGFAEERKNDLWRGVGIACTYVGGLSEAALKDIIFKAGDGYKTQLKAGAVMVAVSRHYAGYTAEDTSSTCKAWCNKNIEEAVLLSDAVKAGSSAAHESAYTFWIKGLEAQF